MIFVVLFHIGFNLFLLFLVQAASYVLRWKRYRMLRKYAKTRSEQHHRIQKKLRHQRWKNQTEEILGKPKEVQNEQEPVDYELAKASNDQVSIEVSSIELSEQDLQTNAPALNRMPSEAP